MESFVLQKKTPRVDKNRILRKVCGFLKKDLCVQIKYTVSSSYFVIYRILRKSLKLHVQRFDFKFSLTSDIHRHLFKETFPNF